MYIQHSVHIDQSVKACTEALVSGARKWFPRLGTKNVGAVGFHVAGVPLRKRVTVELGEPVKAETWTVLPVSWKATFPEKLFPEMTGRIELAPVEEKVTRLTVSGMYQPPLGPLGRHLDDALMHNVAQATVKELAESIAKRLGKSLASRGKK
jgi:hypothetical protein